VLLIGICIYRLPIFSFQKVLQYSGNTNKVLAILAIWYQCRVEILLTLPTQHHLLAALAIHTINNDNENNNYSFSSFSVC